MNNKRIGFLISGLWLYAALFCPMSCTTRASTDFQAASKNSHPRMPETASPARVIKLSDSPFQDYVSPPVLQFISEEEGWMAADTRLWRTTSGGKNWNLVFTSDADLHFISELNFVSAKVGWIAIFNEIYRTEDGGDTWTQIPSPFKDGYILSLRFQADKKTGWVAGDIKRPTGAGRAHKSPDASSAGDDDYSPVTFNTQDGGKSWQRQPTPSATGIAIWHWLDPSHVWAFGENIFYWKNGRWAKVNYAEARCDNREFMRNLRDEHPWPYNPATVYFFDDQTGWISYTSGYMAKTTDGGRTWCDLLRPGDVWPAEGLDAYFTKLYFSNPMRGWASDGIGKLYATEDGGTTWTIITTTVRFDTIYFLDERRVWGRSKEGIFRINLL